ncbi:MAG: PAS domain-containing protein [Alphaproteobacteria bacterium]
MTPSPDQMTPCSGDGGLPGDVAFAVHGPGGRVVASSDHYGLVARALGCAPDAAPPWLGEVGALLAAGHPVVNREDDSADGTRIIASEHLRIADAANGEPLIAARYRIFERPHAGGPPGSAAQRLADVLRLSSEWLYETDAALVLTYISDRVFDDIGALPAELIGQPLPEIGVFDSGPACFAEQRDPARRRPFVDRMADVRHANGQVRRVRFSGVPIFVDNVFAGYRGIARDETRQQSASDAAMRAESRLTVGLAASRDGFAVFDGHGLLVCANPQIAFDLGRCEPLSPGTELGKLLNHALKTGWFVDTDAPALAAARPSLTDPSDGQAMIEIGLADGRRVLFCASRTDCDDVLLISTDISTLGTTRHPTLRRTA